MELIIRSNHMQEVEGVTAEYPYVLNRADGDEIRVPWHWHEEVEFSYVKQGRLRVTISGQRYVFAAGEGFFINSNILHAMEPADSTEKVLWDSHMFHPMLLGGQYRSVFDTKYLAPVLKNKKCELIVFREETAAQKEILRLLQQAADVQDRAYSEFRTRNVFSEIWLLVLEEVQSLEKNAKFLKPVNQERIQTMLEYIQRHYQEKITLEQIAAAASISKRECLRCFQHCIQKTPVEYLVEYRIQMAEKLLRNTDLPITEIALRTGFSNSAYFSKIFREHWNVSPTQFRKTH